MLTERTKTATFTYVWYMYTEKMSTPITDIVKSENLLHFSNQENENENATAVSR